MILAAMLAVIVAQAGDGGLDLNVGIGAGAAILAVAGSSALFWTYLRPALNRISKVEKRSNENEQRIEILVDVLRENAIPIPLGIWDSPPTRDRVRRDG